MTHSDQFSVFEPIASSSAANGLTEGLNYGWMGTVAAFLVEPLDDWLQQLNRNYQVLYRQRATATQQQAWLDCGSLLRSQLSQLVCDRSESSEWVLIFEYELPLEGGRRPDLVVLAAGQILVFEFKQKRRPSRADMDQVAAYARDLMEYHSESRNNPVVPLLVPTRDASLQLALRQNPASVTVLPPNVIAIFLQQLKPVSPPISPEHWVTANYAPLPTVVQAARRIFEQEPLPEIRRAHSAGIPDLLSYLHQVVVQAHQRHERHLVMITGVPGAGKTLVGLQLVYQHPLHTPGERQSLYLSGNAPLIQVLHYALKSRVFVKEARAFYIQHQVRRQSAPAEHIIVFDEAQRAWDSQRMNDKYGIAESAPVAVVQIAERIPDWCVLVALIGDGQTIHVGEEDGLEQWNLAVANSKEIWQVHCPPEQAEMFTAITSDRLHSESLCNLTLSLRSHQAEQVQIWAAMLLDGQIEAASTIASQFSQFGFKAYLTRDLEQAKAYCRDRYQQQPHQRYGLLASSRARNLVQYGVHNDFKTTQRLNVGAWYVDPPDSPLSCCQLSTVATEFSCQGLELDFPLIAWGNDLRWQAGQWMTQSRQRHVRNPLQLRLNSYRVLLTRGRDGFIVFVPPDRQMDSTYEGLHAAGLIELQSPPLN